MAPQRLRYECKHCHLTVYTNDDFVKFSLHHAHEVEEPDEVASVGFHVECFRELAGEDYFSQLYANVPLVLCEHCGRRRMKRRKRCSICPQPGYECVEPGCLGTRVNPYYYCPRHMNLHYENRWRT